MRKEWTGQNEAEDLLFKRIKTAFDRSTNYIGFDNVGALACRDVPRLREEILDLVHDHLIQGR